MATKSFLKNISLHGQQQSKEFIRALEKSQGTKEKEVEFSRPVSDMSREEIRKVFQVKGQEA